MPPLPDSPQQTPWPARRSAPPRHVLPLWPPPPAAAAGGDGVCGRAAPSTHGPLQRPSLEPGAGRPWFGVGRGTLQRLGPLGPRLAAGGSAAASGSARHHSCWPRHAMPAAGAARGPATLPATPPPPPVAAPTKRAAQLPTCCRCRHLLLLLWYLGPMRDDAGAAAAAAVLQPHC